MRLLSLGAINKSTGKYVYPKIANKKDEYICPDCNKDLILCQGEIRNSHYRHKSDNVNPCYHFSNPTETQIHKDAKILLKTLLERKVYITFVRNCFNCKKNEEYEIPEMTETSKIEIEYRFDFNGQKIADVAYIDDGDILCIFEICNTHKTCGENRPEPWFEVNAEALINMANDNNITELKLTCIRYEKCEDCINYENANLKELNIEKYVRIKLGQKYPIPDYDDNRRIKHLRINFDAQNECEYINNNKKIMEIFKTDFEEKNIVFHSWKGCGYAFIVNELSYKKYKYWNNYIDEHCIDENNEQFPYEKRFQWCSGGTVQFIIKLINYCQTEKNNKINKIKQINDKITKLNNQMKSNRQKYENDINYDYDSFWPTRDDHKLIQKHINALEQELVFVENDVKYVLVLNFIIIKHPFTNTKIKVSLVSRKTWHKGQIKQISKIFYKGQWRTNIYDTLIISWYHSNYDMLDEL